MESSDSKGEKKFEVVGRQAGRITLLKSVLLSLPIYQISLNLLPKKTQSALVSLFRNFLWGVGRMLIE